MHIESCVHSLIYSFSGVAFLALAEHVQCCTGAAQFLCCRKWKKTLILLLKHLQQACRLTVPSLNSVYSFYRKCIISLI